MGCKISFTQGLFLLPWIDKYHIDEAAQYDRLRCKGLRQIGIELWCA